MNLQEPIGSWNLTFFFQVCFWAIYDMKLKFSFILGYFVWIILGDPGAVSQVRRKGATKVFKYGPYLKTFVLPFLPTRLTAPGSQRMRACWCSMLFRKVWNRSNFLANNSHIFFVPWSPKRCATMLDPFAQFFQHCWGHARSLRMVYKDLWVAFFPRCIQQCWTLHVAYKKKRCVRLHGALPLRIAIGRNFKQIAGFQCHAIQNRSK